MPKHKIDEQMPEGAVFEENQTPESPADREAKLLDVIEKMQTGMNEMQNKITKLEKTGNDKNLQRKYDLDELLNSEYKDGHIPSLDGKDPIINWWPDPEGRSYIDGVTGMEVDTQAWFYETKSGQKGKMLLSQVPSAIGGTPIFARCIDWREYMEKVHDINEKKHKFQEMKVKMKNPDRNFLELDKQIKEEEAALTMKITLSEDNGFSYTGETFDILAKMWNA